MQYYLFIDECGHPSLKNIDPSSPYFSLCGIITTKEDYQELKLAISAIKMKYWGNDSIIFHSYHIRMQKGDFSIFKDVQIKNEFYADLDRIMSKGKYAIVSPVIHKIEHLEKYGANAHEVYNTSITFLFERCIKYIDKQMGASGKELKIAFEKRGKKEDEGIKIHIQKLLNYGNAYTSVNDFRKYNRFTDGRHCSLPYNDACYISRKEKSSISYF
jgi:hypothetical protein